jgi:5-hydroxyisourate hydrolase-like protein (transthyretin family)
MMLASMIFLSVLATLPGSSIETTIRGSDKPLEVELFRRDDGDHWNEVAHELLPAVRRSVRFDGLEAGVYQIRVRGTERTEQLATKVVVGRNDDRTTTIDITPFEITGRVTLGGSPLGTGRLVLRNKEFEWRSAVTLGDDGSFRVPLWQRGTYTYSVSGPAIPTSHVGTIDIDGARIDIDIPDGRILGIVRDAKSGMPAVGVTVSLQTRVGEKEQVVRLVTGTDGRFDFTGVQRGAHTVRLFSPAHLDSEPIAFAFDEKNRYHELDVKLDPGRTIPIVVVDANEDPVADAHVFAVANAKLRARTKTDEDGRAGVAAPAGEETTLFIVPAQSAFAMRRVARNQATERLRIDLPA